MQKLYVPGNVFQRALSIETGVVCCSSKRYLAITHSMLSNVRLTCQNHYTRAADEHQCERNSVIICDDRRHAPVIAVINVKNFHGSLTTVVRAQNDTSKTANITDTIFDRTHLQATAF